MKKPNKTAFPIQTFEFDGCTQQCFLCLPPYSGNGNEKHYYIIVSAIAVPVETLIFPAHKVEDIWKIKDFSELPGSQKNTTDISKVIEEAGYTIVET